jgi:lysophospholipase L1-like esterase
MKISKGVAVLVTLVLIVLGSSLFVNLLLYRRANQYYRELNQTRLDPLGLENYPINSSLEVSSQSRVVFWGDSRAASWSAPDTRQYKFINRGINGQTSSQTSQRFAEHVRSLKPDIVIIQVGINDLKTIALFPERKAAIIANCQANIKRMVDDSRKLGTVVIVTTVFPVGEVPLERKLFWSDQINPAIKEVNAYIGTLAEEKTIVFDAFAVLADEQGMVLKQYRADELHLNEKGYAALNQNLLPILMQME